MKLMPSSSLSIILRAIKFIYLSRYFCHQAHTMCGLSYLWLCFFLHLRWFARSRIFITVFGQRSSATDINSPPLIIIIIIYKITCSAHIYRLLLYAIMFMCFAHIAEHIKNNNNNIVILFPHNITYNNCWKLSLYVALLALFKTVSIMFSTWCYAFRFEYIWPTVRKFPTLICGI